MVVFFFPFKSPLFIFSRDLNMLLGRNCHSGKLYLILHLLKIKRPSVKIFLCLVFCNLNIICLGIFVVVDLFVFV